MTQHATPATFMRGGTSKGLMFLAGDLPAGIEAQDRLFLAALGSPDPNGRQLDGMGGGLSSLSKICVVSRSDSASADIDYVFAQVAVEQALVDRRGNCGNMSAAVGPFALDRGLVHASGEEALVRLRNRNTGKIVHARFPVVDGRPRYEGDQAIPGVAGTGAPIRLDFIDPGGASTGMLLPTGARADRLDLDGTAVAVSMVDAGNACLFVDAASVGLGGDEPPEAIENDRMAMARLARLRTQASLAMGIAADAEEAVRIATIPYLVIVSPMKRAMTLIGTTLGVGDADLLVRVLAGGRIHRAIPLTVALCTAVAAALPGTIVPAAGAGARVRLATPSGVIDVDADVEASASPHVRSASFVRTARPLFEGRVLTPGHATG